MIESDTLPARPEKGPEADERPETAPRTDEEARQGRRFSVAPMRGRARGRVRYIEGTLPPRGCRFLE